MLLQDFSPILQNFDSINSKQLSACSLKWRDRKLLVRPASSGEGPELILHDFDRLVECLKRSPVEMVKLAPDLHPELLLRWADACAKANKVCYLSASRIPESLTKENKGLSYFSKVIYRFLALLILLVSSPLFLLVLLLSQTEAGKKIKLKWAIGDRGKLFQTWVWSDGPGWLPYLQSRYTQLVHILKGDLALWSSMPITLD
jgi:hypothetical protein